VRLWILVPLMLLLGAGCTRTFYRNWADAETYGEVQERNNDPRWEVDKLTVYGDPRARFYDPYNPDHPPLPPDDPAAAQYMVRADGIKGYKGWHKDGDAPWIEDPGWRDYLDLDKSGALVLKQDDLIEIGVINSREYQSQLEALYLNALALSLNRFEFALHWFGTNNTTYEEFGSPNTGVSNLTTTSNLGFTRDLSWGGQLLVDFANSYVFQFSGLNHAYVNSSIGITLTQPLLRHFGKDVRMEALTEGERSLLYQLRTFARYRKTFAVQEASTAFLGLLSLEQTIRNQRENVKTLEQSYRLHEALLAAGIVTSVQVDQVFQNLQQGQLTLIQQEANQQTLLDQFKISLGLPPSLDVKIDDALLKQFQLTDSQLNLLQKNIESLQVEYRELDQPPTAVKLEDGFKRLKELHARSLTQAQAIEQEIEAWRQRSPTPGTEKGLAQRERASQELQLRDLADTKKDLAILGKAIAANRLAPNQIDAMLATLLRQADTLVGAVSELYVIQTQVRVYQIKLKPIPFDTDSGTAYALANRLDLMNARGQVIDAWRQIDVTANALKAGFDVVFNGNLTNPPLSTNPINFRSAASNYSIGFLFDSPLNRFAERNAYRASQITYQQQRRAFMAAEDDVVRAVRFDVRQCRADSLSFEIARQSLISAARNVEATRELLVVNGATASPTSTLDILNALNNVLLAENSLISSWVQYEVDRIRLLLDTEALQVDERGMYRDDYVKPADQPAPGNATAAAPGNAASAGAPPGG
jgi:outer membrane protein TolC